MSLQGQLLSFNHVFFFFIPINVNIIFTNIKQLYNMVVWDTIKS